MTDATPSLFTAPRRKNGGKVSKAITVPRLRRAISRYYERHGAGGSLHIVLDDGNIRRSHVEFCLRRAVQDGDAPGAMLARALLRASISQRRRVS